MFVITVLRIPHGTDTYVNGIVLFFLLYWKITWWFYILPISFLLLPFCSVMMPLGILLRFTDIVINCIMISHDMFSTLLFAVSGDPNKDYPGQSQIYWHPGI